MLTIIFRAAVMYLALIIGIRLMGKRQIGEMQPSELVVTLLISEMAAIPLQDISQPVLLGVTAIATLVFLEIGLSVISLKFPKLHRTVSGSPRIIIKNGVINQKELKNLRITVSDFVELLRDRDVFDISEVAYAIMETSGSLNIILKGQFQPATHSDLGKTGSAELFLPVISDGILMPDAIKTLGILRRDIDEILKTNKSTVSEIFLLSTDRELNYTIIKKDKR